MKITALELYKVAPRWLFLKTVTDDGICGWGEPVIEGRADTVEAAVKEAKEELASDDNDRIVKATEKLSNDVQGVFTKLYQQAQQAQGQGAPNGEQASDGDTEFHQN